MGYLFLLISLIYAWVFYMLSQVYTARNLLIEAAWFAVFWVISFIFFLSSWKKKKQNIVEEEDDFDDEDELEKKWKFSLENIISKETMQDLLYSFSYYIGFSMLYIWLYFIGKNYNIEISQIILGISSLTIIGFLLVPNNKMWYDFLKINSILFSLIYIFYYINIIINNNQVFSLVDIWNSLLIILWFWILLFYSNSKNEDLWFSDGIDLVIFRYFFVYLFSIIYFYSYFYLFKADVYFWLSVISVFYSFFLFEIFTRFNLFKKYYVSLRILWIIFLYFWTLVGIWYLLFVWKNLAIIISLAFSALFNYFIHHRYQNYISFGIAWFSMLFIWYYILLNILNLDYKAFDFFVISLFTSFAVVFINYIAKFKYREDYYFISFVSYFINIVSLILFFMYTPLSWFNLWVVLVLDSVYFFASYHKLKQINS